MAGLSCLVLTSKVQSIIGSLQKKYPDYNQKDLYIIYLAAADQFNTADPSLSQIERYMNSRKLSNTSKNLNNGTKQVSIQRMDIAAQSGAEKELTGAISILQKAERSSSKENKRGSGEIKQNKLKIIESWAKENNLWVDNMDATLRDNFGLPYEGGGEAVIYDAGKDVAKSISLDYYDGDVELALDRILLHNYLFPEAKLTDIGFGKDTDGTFKILVYQPFIAGNPATREEIINYAKNRGFETIDNNIYYFKGIKISDLNEYNVIKTDSGELAVIDAELRFSENNIVYSIQEKEDKTESITQDLQKLKTLNNKTLKSLGSETKINDALKRLGVSSEIRNAILGGYKAVPSIGSLSPLAALRYIASSQYKGLVQQYNESIRKEANLELEKRLENFLKKYNVTVNIGDAVKKFGDISGVYDIINKIIYVANNRNELTLPEEFGHSFVELMGSTTSKKEENKDFTFLMDTVEDTQLYKQVYEDYKDVYKREDGTPDTYKIKKEAIGQAIGLALISNYKGEDIQTKSFLQKVKDWVQKILDKFTGSEYLSFENLVNTIAKEVLSGDTKRLDKVDQSNYRLLDYYKTIEEQNKKDGGKALDFMQWFTSIGNLITGSLAYRLQGATYRGNLDTLHDIDMEVPQSVHGINFKNSTVASAIEAAKVRNQEELFEIITNLPYFNKIKEKYPKIKFGAAYADGKGRKRITVNAVYSEDENLSNRFLKMTGSYADRLNNFTEEERGKIYLFDFFLKEGEINSFFEPVNNLNLVSFDIPLREKRWMGRAKDIMDYQNWRVFDSFKDKVLPSEEDLMYQLAAPQTEYTVTYTPETTSNKLSDFGVEVNTDLVHTWKSWLQDNPKGIVAFRTSKTDYTNPQYAIQNRVIGNPFYGWIKDGNKERDTKLFNTWLKTGDNAGNPDATEQLRQAFIQLIKDAAQSGAKVLYYTDIPARQSHAAVIGYYIQHPEELDATPTITPQQLQQTQKEKKTAPKPISQVELPNVNRTRLNEEVNRTFGNSRIKDDRVRAIATTFSDVVDLLIEEAKENGEEVKNRQKFIISHLKDILGYTYVDDNGQQQVVEGLLQDAFNPDNADDEEVAEAMSKFSYTTNPNVWMALLEQAAPMIQQYEGIIINMHNKSIEQNQANREEDWEANGEDILSLKDGWMIKARELDLRDTLSQKTRRLLARIKEALGYDENGEPKVQYDDLGFVRYLNPDYAHLKLLGVLSKATDSNDFDRLLEEMAKKESWVTFLSDEFEADPSIKAAFYGDLRKEFIPYWIHFNSNDGAMTKQLNFEPSILYYMKEWEHNYNGHIQLSDNSVFNNDGSANNQHIEEALNKYTELKDKYLNGFENFEDYSALKGLFDDLGISYTEEELEYAITTSEEPTETINTVLGGIRTILTKLQNEGVKSSPVRQFKSAFMDIANALNLIPQGATMAAFMENGKNYQSYANPSWIGTWINSIHSDAGVEYLAKEYGQYKHFYKDGRWRGPWLQLMMGKDGKKYRDLLDRKVVLKSEDKEYTDWTDKEYFNVIFREFLATNNKDTAYYYLPILADAPSSEFIRFKRYSDKDYKDTILEGLYEVFLQEVDRIQLVQSRKNTDGVYPIQNLDKFGGQFNFFPSLNNKEFLDEYNSLLAKDNKNTQEGNPTSYSKTFAIKAIQAEMENGFAEFTKDVVNFGYKANDPTIENYYWNNALAYTQIVTLTTTDLAYYKGLSDFQKRYKEVYSMTRRLYENATYPDGSLVGTTEQSALQRDENGVYEWVITLKDIKVPATIIEEASAAVRRRIGPDLTKVEADYIISQMESVNAADAQAFRSLDSYRDVLTMSGDWSTEMETAYQHLNSPNAQDWTVEDFNVLWLTIKPFLFGMKSVDSQVTLSDKTPYGNLRVPIQFKNSEALLLSLYSKIAEKETESPLLVALGKVMRGDLTPGRKISSIQFESAEKAGGQAAISLKDVNLNSEEDILNTFRETLNADKGNFVAKKIYMKDYGIQVTSPEHLYDHYGLIQSQFKKHITANLPDNFSISVQGKSFDRLGVYNLMQQILTENIIESFEECEKIFGSKEAVEAELQKSMAGNTRYTEEDRRACTLFTDSEGNKQWSTLLFDPIQSQRIQNLLMAIIKSKVVKQEARRSYLVQATGVGFTDDLHVRFYDTEGHFIFNEREFNGTEPCRPKFQKQLDKVRNHYSSFQDYISSVKKDSNAIAYHEIAMPPYSRDIIAACQDENGELDISKLPDELREGITLRSPNEAKYSTQPVYIKFFLPRNNGGIIMHPIEITEFVGADFDYDKMMAYFHEFRVIDKKRDEYNDLSIRAKEMWEGNDDVLIDFLANLDLEIAPEFQNTSLQQLITELGATEARQAVGYKAWLSYQKDMNPDNYSRLMKLPVRVEKIKYDINKPVKELSKAQRNNLYFDTAFKVLTNPTVVEQMVSPGNFDELKRLSKIKKVIRDVPIEDIRKEIDAIGMSLEDTLEKLYTIKEEKAKEILTKYAKPLDPKSVNTQLYFHRQNANAGKMIGIYAVASSAHSLFQYTSTGFKTPINIMGTTIKTIDPVKDRNGKWVSKNMEQFTAASVDDVKDPTLSDLNQNTFTGDFTNAMIRMGFPISVATNVVMAKDYAVVREDEELNTQITEKELITLIYYQSKDNLTPTQHAEVLTGKATYDSTLSLEERTKMNDLMKKFRVTSKVVEKAARDISKVTLASRSDSPNNSAGPTIGDALMRFIKLLNLFESFGKKTFNIYTNAFDKEALLGDAALGQRDDIIDYVFSEEAYDTGKVRDNAYNNAIPFIEAATKLGVLGPLKLLRNYFPQLNAANVKLLLNKENGLLSYLNSGSQSEENGVKLINRFFNDYYIYALNNTDFFGKTTDVNGTLSKSKLYNSSYYMLTFPEHLMDWFNNQKNKETINNNALLRNLEFPIKNGVRMVVFSNAKDLSKEEKAKVSDAWTDLVCSDDVSLQSIGYQLFKYGSFMGLNYTGPQSFIHLAPAVVRESIEDYYRGLTALEKNDFNYGLPFIEQFIRNNYTMRGFLPQIKSSNIADFNEDSPEKITVKDVARVTIDTIETYTQDGNIVEDPVLAKVVVLAYRDKSQNTINRLYKQDNVIKDAQGRVIGVSYSELTPLGINGFKEYYQGVSEPSSVLDHYSKRDYLLKDTPKSSEVPSDEVNAGDEVINPDDFMPEEEASYREIEDALSSNSEPIIITPADPVDPDTKEPICGADLAGVLDSF